MLIERGNGMALQVLGDEQFLDWTSSGGSAVHPPRARAQGDKA
jgi:hypothetical protein